MLSPEKLNQVVLSALSSWKCIQWSFGHSIIFPLKFVCVFKWLYLLWYSESRGGSHERRLLNDLMNSYQKLGRLQNINNIAPVPGSGTTRHQQHSVCGYWDISASYTSRLKILKIFAPCRAAGPEWISSRHRQVRADAAADHGRGEHPSTQPPTLCTLATLTSGQIFIIYGPTLGKWLHPASEQNIFSKIF